MAKPAQKKPAPNAAPVAPPIPSTKTSHIHQRHVAQVVDAVGHTLRKTFPDFGYALVIFDKRKPDQTQHFIGGDRAAAVAAMGAVSKKLGAS